MLPKLNSFPNFPKTQFPQLLCWHSNSVFWKGCYNINMHFMVGVPCVLPPTLWSRSEKRCFWHLATENKKPTTQFSECDEKYGAGASTSTFRQLVERWVTRASQASQSSPEWRGWHCRYFKYKLHLGKHFHPPPTRGVKCSTCELLCRKSIIPWAQW